MNSCAIVSGNFAGWTSTPFLRGGGLWRNHDFWNFNQRLESRSFSLLEDICKIISSYHSIAPNFHVIARAVLVRPWQSPIKLLGLIDRIRPLIWRLLRRRSASPRNPACLQRGNDNYGSGVLVA